MLVIAAVIFLVVVAGVVYSVGPIPVARSGERSPGRYSDRGSWKFYGRVVPLAIVTGLFIVTVHAMVLIDAPREASRPPDITVTGHQWWWEARYPNGVIATWDIHIPASRRLLVRIESGDVIHDFWAPNLARKMDAVPGRKGYIWLEAGAPGTYAGSCSEFCGARACLDALSRDRRSGAEL